MLPAFCPLICSFLEKNPVGGLLGIRTGWVPHLSCSIAVVNAHWLPLSTPVSASWAFIRTSMNKRTFQRDVEGWVLEELGVLLLGDGRILHLSPCFQSLPPTHT